MPTDTRYLGSAKIIACCTLASRVTGLARDMVLNHVYGQRWVQDAFNYGFLIPNLFRRLFGEGALSAVFIPVFMESLDKRGRDAAWILLGRITGLLSLALVILTILLELGVLVIGALFPAGSMRTLQLGLTGLMLPFMISVCLLALFSSILNCLRHFAVPALMPIVLNVMNIFGALVVGPRLGEALDTQIYGVAISVLAASVLQLLIILPVLRSHGVRFRIGLDLSDPDVRRILRMFIPVLLGQGVLLFNVFFDSQLCTFLTRGPTEPESFRAFGATWRYPLAEGALSAINNAQRLYQFPLGVLAISLATAAFPLFSLYASREDHAGLRNTLAQSIRVALFEGLPCAAVLVLLGRPIIALLFEHGRFGPPETQRAAWVLTWYALGVPAFCTQHIVLRGFYSLKDTLTPMWISCALVVVNVLLSLSLVWHPAIREAAFGISTSTTAYAHIAISLLLLRRRLHGRIGARAISQAALRAILCTSAAALAVWLIVTFLPPDAPRLGPRLVRVFAPLAGAMAAYLLFAGALRMEELAWLFKRRAVPALDAESIPPADAS